MTLKRGGGAYLWHSCSKNYIQNSGQASLVLGFALSDGLLYGNTDSMIGPLVPGWADNSYDWY